MALILHMTSRSEWEAAQVQGWYAAESLQSEGFIHCSTVSQILGVANGLYQGAQNMVLLQLDESLVDADIVYEDCYETGQDFPHIYGRLNLDAVVDVLDFPCDQDGKFALPAGV